MRLTVNLTVKRCRRSAEVVEAAEDAAEQAVGLHLHAQADETFDFIGAGLKRLVDHFGGDLTGARIAVAPRPGTVPDVLDAQPFQFGQDFRRHIARIDRAEQVLGHALDDLGQFRIAISEPAQDGECIVAAQRFQDGVEVRGVFCLRAASNLACHR